MQCWNCGQDIPDAAMICEFCEAVREAEPTEEEIEAVHEALEQRPPEVLEALQDAIHHSKTGEEFVNRIMVGECPGCGSEDTGDCEHDPEIDSVAVGRCFECGQLWCTVWDGLLEKDRSSCACWEEDE